VVNFGLLSQMGGVHSHPGRFTAGETAPRCPLNRNLGGRQKWSGRFAEGKNTFFARNRTLNRRVPGLDILPATVFCEVGIEVLCTNQMNYSRHWLSVSGLDCQW